MGSSKNRFDTFIDKQLNNTELILKQSQKTDKYLLKVSRQFGGTPASAFFNYDEIDILREFLDIMRRYRLPGCAELRLLAPQPFRTLSDEEAIYGPKAGTNKIKHIINRATWKQLWSGKAYFIGAILGPGKLKEAVCPVYICTDLKLRCFRGAPAFNVGQMQAYGVGNIPDLNKLGPHISFSVGKYATHNDGYGNEETVFGHDNLEDMLKAIVGEQVLSKL
jgi:hypothetical protein